MEAEKQPVAARASGEGGVWVSAVSRRQWEPMQGRSRPHLHRGGHDTSLHADRVTQQRVCELVNSQRAAACTNATITVTQDVSAGETGGKVHRTSLYVSLPTPPWIYNLFKVQSYKKIIYRWPATSIFKNKIKALLYTVGSQICSTVFARTFSGVGSCSVNEISSCGFGSKMLEKYWNLRLLGRK